jgi:hypothetical protein
VRLINIYSGGFARASDGRIGVCGTAYGADGSGAPFVAIIAPDGSTQTVVRTAPYYPINLVFAADGSLWTDGKNGVDGKESDSEHVVIRRFGTDGKVRSGLLPRSGFAIPDHPAKVSFLVSSRDRVGWYSATAKVYIEFALDGTEIQRYPTPSILPIVSGALCEDNGFWVASSTKVDAAGHGTLNRLDRQHGSWSALTTREPKYLSGCDGVELASKERNVISWLAVR